MPSLKKKILLLVLILSGVAMVGILFLSPRQAAEIEQAGEYQTTVTLPAPRLEGDMSLEQALTERRSGRDFADEAVQLEDLAQLLWAAQGITEADKELRTAPSAYSIYPLQLYVAAGNVEGLEPGIYRYLVSEHKLGLVKEGDPRTGMLLGVKQPVVKQAPLSIIVCGNFSKMEKKAGEAAERCVYLEAGHASQNILLQATALGLQAVPVGGFSSDSLGKRLPLTADETSLYVIPVGNK